MTLRGTLLGICMQAPWLADLGAAGRPQKALFKVSRGWVVSTRMSVPWEVDRACQLHANPSQALLSVSPPHVAGACAYLAPYARCEDRRLLRQSTEGGGIPVHTREAKSDSSSVDLMLTDGTGTCRARSHGEESGDGEGSLQVGKGGGSWVLWGADDATQLAVHGRRERGYYTRSSLTG